MGRARYLGCEPERAPRNAGLSQEAVDQRNLRYRRTQMVTRLAAYRLAASNPQQPEAQRAAYRGMAERTADCLALFDAQVETQNAPATR